MPEEEINLIKPGSTIHPETAFKISSPYLVRQPIGGREGLKHQLRIPGRKKPRSDAHDLSFIVKEYNGDEKMSKESLLELAKFYVELHQKGYPVPTTARYFERRGRPCLALSDLTEGGKKLVWGYNDDHSKQEARTIASMHLNHMDIKRISISVEELSKKATQDNLYFDFHYYHIRKDPITGEIDVVLLDVDTNSRNHQGPSLAFKNQESAKYFLQTLKDIVKGGGHSTIYDEKTLKHLN